MANNRFQLKQFAGNASNNGVFGSYSAGASESSSDPETIQSLPAWLNGWLNATTSASILPRLEEMQGVQFVLCKAILENYKEGIPSWLSTESYYKGSWCTYADETHEFDLYTNQTGTFTTTNPAEDTTNWRSLTDLIKSNAGSGRNVGELVPSVLPLSDAGLHLLDGSLIAGSGVYADFVNYIAGLYGAKPLYAWQFAGDYIYTLSTLPSAGSQIYNADGTVNTSWIFVEYGNSEVSAWITCQDGSGEEKSFVRASNRDVNTTTTRPAYFCTESEWQSSVSAYGVCGKFVYDASANTVRLPKITGFVEGTTDISALGALIEAGLPNITGLVNSLPASYYGTATRPGALKVTGIGGNAYSGNSNGTNVRIDLDASWSNPTYGNSTTVQPQSIKILFYICVATSTKTDVEININNIVGDLNGLSTNKADKTGTNLSASFPYNMGLTWYDAGASGVGVGGCMQIPYGDLSHKLKIQMANYSSSANNFTWTFPVAFDYWCMVVSNGSVNITGKTLSSITVTDNNVGDSTKLGVIDLIAIGI